MQPDRAGFERRRGLGAGIAAALLPAWPAWAQAPAGVPRVALVIGNAAYPAAALRNAVHDAEAMAKALAELGFRVVRATDASKNRMNAAIAEAKELLQGQAGVGLLFYAGHAVQLDWRNFLLPVDASPATAAQVPQQAIDVQVAIEAFSSAGSRLNIVALDACRDNPFGAAAGGGKGLAPLDAPPGTYLAYATAPGHTADDGDAAAGNGLYTRFLLREIAQPQARIEDVFKRVRLQVRRASAGRQVPWDSTSLEEDFFFGSGQQAPEASSREREVAFEEQKVHWDRIRDSSRAEDFYAYLQRYPSGLMSELAQFRLDQLARPVVQPQRSPATSVPVLPSGADRFRVGDTFEYVRIDRLAGNSETTYRHRVTAIESGRVIINQGRVILDQMGNTLHNGHGTKDPGVLVAPADMQVGKRWRSSFRNVRPDGDSSSNYHDYRVVALEELDIPAGRFNAYKVVGTGHAVGSKATLVLNYWRWFDPGTMHALVSEWRFVTTRGQTSEHVVDKMVARRLAPRV